MFYIKLKLNQLSVLFPLIFILGFILFIALSATKSEHLANYQKDEFYKEFITSFESDKNQKLEVKGEITPHHLFAHSLMERLFLLTKNSKVGQVILLAPNHFDQGRSLAITSLAIWQTNFGKIYPAQDSIKKLIKDGIISTEEEPFKKEHGVYNLLPYIKIAFPRAKIIPIILKARLNQNTALQLVQKLTQIDSKNTLIIASLDFSHYQTPSVAQEHDKKSIEVIKNLDLENVWNLDVDSPPVLYVFLSYLKKIGYNNFTLVDNTNSGFLSGNYGLAETTSYITGYLR